MIVQTLEDLKRENAEASEQAEVESNAEAEVEEEAVDTEEVEEVADPETDTEETTEVETESWMTDDDEASTDSVEQTIPLKAHIRKREKLKGMNDDLRRELDEVKEQLKTRAGPVVAQATETQAIPTLEQFDYDEAKFGQAMGEYYSKKRPRPDCYTSALSPAASSIRSPEGKLRKVSRSALLQS